jgi:hypothetical protein
LKHAPNPTIVFVDFAAAPTFNASRLVHFFVVIVKSLPEFRAHHTPTLSQSARRQVVHTIGIVKSFAITEDVPAIGRAEVR